jgi:hypothetical protein
MFAGPRANIRGVVHAPSLATPFAHILAARCRRHNGAKRRGENVGGRMDRHVHHRSLHDRGHPKRRFI